MKRIIAPLLILLAGGVGSFAQSSSWKNITDNLPRFHRDTTIINGGADTILAAISGISFIDDHHGWICTSHPYDGDSSAVLETTDGGQTWTVHHAPLSCRDLHMTDENTGYLGANNGIIYKTTNGGKTWNYHGHLLVPLYDIGFPPRPAQTGYAGGKNGRMALITPQGVTPFDLGLAGNVYCIDFPSVERGYALLDYQMIIFYQAGEWHVEASYPFSSKNWLHFRNDTLGWCVGEMFLKTTVGIDWYRTDPGIVLKGALLGLFFTDESTGWAAGTLGQIAYSLDGGEDWTMLEHTLTNAILTGVYFTSPGHGFIIGGSKTILRYGPVNGINESQEAAFRVYPNPTQGRLTIIRQAPAEGGGSTFPPAVKVTDLSGRIVMPLREGTFSGNKMDYDVSGLPAGMYLLQIRDDHRVTVKKLFKL